MCLQNMTVVTQCLISGEKMVGETNKLKKRKASFVKPSYPVYLAVLVMILAFKIYVHFLEGEYFLLMGSLHVGGTVV